MSTENENEIEVTETESEEKLERPLSAVLDTETSKLIEDPIYVEI